MNKKLQSLYGLKWHPFNPGVPTEACRSTPAIDHFVWRVENLAREGGFALVTGDPGTGKSVVLRMLCAKLSTQRDVTVGLLTRPQSSVPDCFRELGELFGARLSPHNRWAGTKVLRERWQAHIEATLFRAILIVDEAQEMRPAVLQELRLLSASQLDSRALLTVVLAGDRRLTDRFRQEELLPLGSRIRVRLALGVMKPDELAEVLRHAMTEAGNPQLMTAELVRALAEHAAGNLRMMMNLACDLLDAAVKREAPKLDEKLYLEFFSVPPRDAGTRRKGDARGGV